MVCLCPCPHLVQRLGYQIGQLLRLVHQRGTYHEAEANEDKSEHRDNQRDGRRMRQSESAFSVAGEPVKKHGAEDGGEQH